MKTCFLFMILSILTSCTIGKNCNRESGTITVSYEAEQPGDFYRTVDIYGNIPNNSLMVSFIGTVK